jgi:WD40 repeat protein
MHTIRSLRFLCGLVGCCFVWLLAACSPSAGPATTTPTATRPAQGATLLTYHGHSGRVISLQWSTDGTRILSGSLDGTARCGRRPEGSIW